MFGRSLPPLVISEFDAEVLEEAIEHHLGRLQRTMNEERDRADRMAWARADRRRWSLSAVYHRLRAERETMGPMRNEDLEHIEHEVAWNARRMPRSARNAEALQAERETRVKAEDARKAAVRAERERFKRIFGKVPDDDGTVA